MNKIKHASVTAVNIHGLKGFFSRAWRKKKNVNTECWTPPHSRVSAFLIKRRAEIWRWAAWPWHPVDCFSLPVAFASGRVYMRGGYSRIPVSHVNGTSIIGRASPAFSARYVTRADVQERLAWHGLFERRSNSIRLSSPSIRARPPAPLGKWHTRSPRLCSIRWPFYLLDRKWVYIWPLMFVNGFSDGEFDVRGREERTWHGVCEVIVSPSR